MTRTVYVLEWQRNSREPWHPVDVSVARACVEAALQRHIVSTAALPRSNPRSRARWRVVEYVPAEVQP